MTLHLFEYFELLSLVFAIVLYKHLKVFKLDAFLPLLFIVCVTEVFASNKEWFGLSKTYIIYNYYFIVSTPVYFWAFLKILDFKGFIKTIFLVITGLVMLFIILNFLFLQGQYYFDSYSSTMIDFILGVLSLMIITKLFREDNYEIEITSNPYFWIAGATLIFSVSSIVLLGLQQFILLNKIQINGKSIYRIILPLINVVLYSSYCYAFYLCKKLSKRLKTF
jgi:hypothetical protein